MIFFWVCKGDCDHKISKKIRLTSGHIDSWEDISDLDIPLKYISWLFAQINTIRSGKTVYDNEAFIKLKQFIGAMAQRVFREMTELERQRLDSLREFGIF